MSEASKHRESYPAGEYDSAAREVAREAGNEGTFSGTVHVGKEPDAVATPLGDLAFFRSSQALASRS